MREWDRPRPVRRRAKGWALLLGAALLATSCSTSRTRVGGETDLAIANAKSEGKDGLKGCDDRIGSVAIAEADANAQILSSAGLPRSMAPLVRHLLIRTRCFTVVDRGAAFALLEQERRLREQYASQQPSRPAPELRTIRPVDYVMRAEIVFAEQTGGGKGLLGGVFSDVIGGIGADVRRKEAVVLLSVVDARTSEIISSVFGRGTSQSAGLGSLVLTSGIGLVEGGWADTPQAKTVAAALVDAWNRTQASLSDLRAPPPQAARAAPPPPPAAPMAVRPGTPASAVPVPPLPAASAPEGGASGPQ